MNKNDTNWLWIIYAIIAMLFLLSVIRNSYRYWKKNRKILNLIIFLIINLFFLSFCFCFLFYGLLFWYLGVIGILLSIAVLLAQSKIAKIDIPSKE